MPRRVRPRNPMNLRSPVGRPELNRSFSRSSKLQLVAGSMRDAFGSTKESRYAGIVEQDGIPTKTRLKNARIAPPEEAASGLPDDRFASVAGKADGEPMFPDNPYLAANRRVTITLIKEAPPIPFGTKP